MDLRRQLQEKNLTDAAQTVPADKLKAKYGAAALKMKSPAQRLLGGQERKYFDSGDWVLSKSGKGDSLDTPAVVGSEHPVPDKIPHLTSPVGTPAHHLPSSLSGAALSTPAKIAGATTDITNVTGAVMEGSAVGGAESGSLLSPDANKAEAEQPQGQQQQQIHVATKTVNDSARAGA